MVKLNLSTYTAKMTRGANHTHTKKRKKSDKKQAPIKSKTRFTISLKPVFILNKLTGPQLYHSSELYE